jgi:flagellar hook-associated protein 1 FlgK
MGMSVLGVSLSSLNATMAGIRTAQHNIANANTEGYHRQDVRLNSASAQYQGGSWLGSGVQVENVVRMYSSFLNNEVRSYEGQVAGSEVYAQYAGQVDSLLGDADSNLNSAMQKFFSGVYEVANNPTSLAAREQMLTQGRNLAGRMQLLGGSLESINSQVNGELDAAVAKVNDLTRRIADLNGAVGAASAQAQDPNDLLDQREILVNELNKLVNVSQIQQSDGSIAVFMSNGQSLVVGNSVQKLQSVEDPTDSSRRTLALQNASGGTSAMNVAGISDGRIGGLIAFRDDVLLPSMKELGRIALTLTDQVNSQHAQGFDLTGAAGGNFFGPADAMLRLPIANAANAGSEPSFGLSLDNSANLTVSDYQLNYDGANYSLVRLSDNVTVGSAAHGGSIVADGLNLTLGGSAPTAGDSWLLRPTVFAAGDMSMALTSASQIAAASGTLGVSNGVGDNANARALAALQSAPMLAGSSATYSSNYNQMMTRNAILAGSAEADAATFSQLGEVARASQQSVSGVNIDEEAAKLIQYQQSYQAAARAMQIASSLFDDILSIR